MSTESDVISWPVEGHLTGLSVDRAEGRVFATCCNLNSVREYTTNGSHVQTIELSKAPLTHPCHGIRLTDGRNRMVVCHEKPEDGISLIDELGRVEATFNHSEKTEKDYILRYVTVTKNSSILVADCIGNAILLLNPTLSAVRRLPMTIDGGLQQPYTLHMDESRHGRLYVGENAGQRVFDNRQYGG